MDDTVLYFDAICEDPFWNSSLTLQNSWPQFTHCFQHTALSWPAYVLFLIMFPWKLLSLKMESRKPHETHFRLSFLFVLRGIGITSLGILSLLLLIMNILDGDRFQSSYVVLTSNSLHFFTYVCVALHIIYGRYKGEVSSGPLFLFWALLVLTETLSLYLRIMNKHYETQQSDFIITSAIFGLIIFECLLCFIPDVKKLQLQEKEKKPWPETRASFPSRMVFAWMSGTVFTAWRRNLTEEDIYDLPESTKGETLIPAFDKAWEKCMVPRELIRRQHSHKENDLANQRRANGPTNDNNFKQISANGTTHGKGAPGTSAFRNGDATTSSSSNDAQDKKPQKEQEEKVPFTLMKALFKLHGAPYSFGFFIKIVGDSLSVLLPLIIREIIETVQFRGEQRPLWIGVMLSLALLLLATCKSMLHQGSLYISTKIGLQVRSALMSAIFKKAMTMSSEARKKYTAGEIITLMSVDAQRVQEVWRIVVMLAGAPVQLIAPAVFLYYTIGISTVSGVLMLLLLLPINSFLAAKMRHFQAANMQLKDKRVKLTTDVLNGIRVLKLYAWEKSFEEKISDIRSQEMANLRTLAFLRTAMAVLNWMTPYLVTLATFATYILISEENHLDPATAFVSMTYFSIMRSPLIIITYIVAGIVMSTVSLKRINRFLYSEDLDLDCVGSNPEEGSAVTVVNADFTWEALSDPVVSGVTLHIPEKSLTMIVGKVGSGKSSLLSGLLGEMKLLSGKVDLKGSVAYVAQQAWIQNASVKDNILFGSPFDPIRYKTVLEACALNRDLSILPKGDETEIGEKGINLSGGQKQRVALARAVYSDKDIYMLDDPLSALDAHVGKQIFECVIGPQGLLRDKTRILVTHGAHWLPHADTVIMLQNGTIHHTGTFEELLSQDSDFIQMLKQTGKDDEDEEEDDEEKDGGADEDGETGEIITTEKITVIESEGEVQKRDMKFTNFGMENDKSAVPMKRLSKKSSSRKEKSESQVSAKGEKDGAKIIQEEKMETGKIRLKVLISWFKAAGLCGLFIYTIVLTMFQAIGSAGTFWIRFWTEDSYLANTSLSHTSKYADKNALYLGIYGAFGAGQILFFVIGYIFYWVSAVRAANRMHRNMLNSILRSPVAFFDTTPIGRMLNRFSLDTDVIDNAFPLLFVDLLKCVNQILATIVVVALNVPLFATVILPMFILFYVLLTFYLPTARQLKRMDTVAKSPIYSHFGEAVGGASTIRAFGHTDRFSEESQTKIDYSVIRSLTFFSCSSWLSLLVDCMGTIIMFSSAIFAVTSSDVKGAEAGLAVSYTVEFSMFLAFVVRQWTDMTANSVSIERILEYTELKPEGLSTEKSTPSSWPGEGRMEFKDFKIRYREGLDLVLKGINASIKPGEKIGIVGRTGAGKSTMTVSLFRIIEAAGGAICIDGINIADVPLSVLRSRLSILPQDPVLFSGTLRMNIDPHDEYSDEEVMRALERAHLKDMVKTVAGGLSYDVGEEGKNLSVGQRQLVCLARALLRQNKILVLDEATAAVDVQTDSFIQETIRTAFKDCTVLTIAHRINTILDYDRVMVLDNGQITEFAPVKDLLSNPNSMFYGLAKEAKVI